MVDNNADFSKKLAYILESRGVSQLWLATEVNTTAATISRYTTGINKPNFELVARIAKALDISIDWLAGLVPDPKLPTAPDPEIALLISAFRRADDDHKNIIWSALNSYLTPQEKASLQAGLEEKKKESDKAS